MPPSRKVLLIGWDAADWKTIQPLLDAGKMPVLKRMVESGVWGRLATLRPILSPMLWTSIATGKRPYLHGIHGFSEPDPDTGRVRPITGMNRKVKAIWNILHQEGLRSNVLGWWPSHPAEPIHGVMVSNHYQRANSPAGKPWPMQPGTVHPQRLVQPLRKLRLHPVELTEQQLLPFVPQAAEIDLKKDPRLGNIARVVADCGTIHAAATAVMQLEPWDFMAVYYDAIDHFGHGFMKYHPPRQPHIAERDFELYQHVIEAGYRYHDMMLGTLLQLAGPETTVILMSDHGFHSDHLRPAHIPHEPAGPAIEHSPYGVIVAKGPGIKQGDRIYGASLLDITPTLLTLFGLPVGDDMQGKPLLDAFIEPPKLQSIPSWEDVPGECGMHPPELRLDAEQSRQSLQQLVDLGYIDDPGENAEQAVKQTSRELKYNLAQAYIDDNCFADAKLLLEQLWHDWPDELRFANQLLICYRSLGQADDMARVAEELLVARKRLSGEAREKLKQTQQLINQRKQEREEAKQRAGNDADLSEKPLLKPQEQHELERNRLLANPGPLVEPYLRGLVALARGELEQAAQLLIQVAEAKPASLAMHLTLGEIFLELREWDAARQAFSTVLEVDADQPRALFGRGRCCLAARQNLEATEHLLDAVALCHFFPAAHHYLGVALHRIGRLPAALKSLQLSLAQNPNNIAAHRRLAHIYAHRLRDLERSHYHKQQAKELRDQRKKLEIPSPTPPRKSTATTPTERAFTWTITSRLPDSPPPPRENSIVVVSGLPRSGTSMMMQMLHRGGWPVLTDGERDADEDNPRGYYEFKQAKQLVTNKQWLREAKGKAVKIIAQLLPHLPLGFGYRMIIMQREIDELIRSQRSMLDRLGKQGASLDETQLAATFARQLNEVDRWLVQRKIPRLVVPYRDALNRPTETAEQLADFLGHGLDVHPMASAVDRQLYRQRQEQL